MSRELLMQNNYEWGTAEGQTLEIENAIRSNIRDLKIEGQTYQNLLGETKDIEYVSTKSELNYIYTLDNLTANTTYTLSYEIKSTNKITTTDKAILFRVEIDKANSTSGIVAGFTGTVDNIYKQYKLTFNTGSDLLRTKINLRNQFNAPGIGLTENTLSVRNLVLLEGDYANRAMITELPTSINGIESVGEREKEGDLYLVKITNRGNNLLNTTTEIPLPQPLRSVPNAPRDTVEGNKLIQRVGKIVVDGTNNISINSVRTNTIRLILTDTTIKNAISSNYPFFCDYLVKTGAIWNTDVEGIYQDSKENRFIMSISRSKLAGTTINDVKSYFAANPMTLYYELATPIEHAINVPRISITKGTNTITTTNNIKPNLSIKYKKLKNKVR